MTHRMTNARKSSHLTFQSALQPQSIVRTFRQTLPALASAGKMAVLTGFLFAMAVGCKEAPDGKETLRKAEKHFAANDYGSAEVEYKNALRANPRELVALLRLGAIWEARGGPFQAARYFQQANHFNPQNPEARLGMARFYLAIGNRAAARREALEALTAAPSNPEAMLLLAKASRDDEEIDDASSRLARFVEDDNARIHLAKAILEMEGSDPASAGAALTRAIALDENWPEAFVVKSKWHFLRNEKKEAEECLLTAVRLAPARSPERAAYASFLINAGRRDEAATLLESTVKETPDFLTAWRMLAKLAMDANDQEKAGKMLDRVLAWDSMDFEANIIRAMLHLSEKTGDERSKAIALLEKMRASHPPNAMLEYHLARARLAGGEMDLADESLTRALQVEPEMRDSILLQAGLRVSQERFDEAVVSLESFLRRQPGDVDAILLLSEAHRRSGNPAKAWAVLSDVVDPPDQEVRWHIEKGAVAKDLGRTDDERTSFEKVEALEPSNLAAAAELVRLDSFGGNQEAALKRAENQRKFHPESAVPFYMRATVMVTQSKVDEAVRDLTEALRIDPKMTAAHLLLARIHSSAGRQNDAIRQLEEARGIDPGNIPVLWRLSELYQLGGQRSELRNCYEEILKRNPNFAPALNNLASILAESPGDELARAHQLAQQARALKSNDPVIADTLGWILYKQGEFRRAHSLLAEAIAGIPDDPLISFHFGMACQAMGDEQGARAAFRVATAASTEFPGRIEAGKSLARMDAVIDPGDAGLRSLKEQVQREPADMITHLKLGSILETSGKHQEAAESYVEALAVNPDLHRAVFRLAHLHAGPLNDPKKAYEYARRAKELSPEDPGADVILAALAFRNGEHERADVLFQSSLSKIRNDTGLMIQAAWAAYSMGRVNDATTLMESVVANSKNPTELADSRRFLDFQKPDVAMDLIAGTLATDPDYVPALMARAGHAEKIDPKTAVPDYEKVLTIYPKFTPAREAIARIQAATTPES